MSDLRPAIAPELCNLRSLTPSCQALWKYSPRRHPITSRVRFYHVRTLFRPNEGKILIQGRAKITAKTTAIGAAAAIAATAGALALAGSALAAATHTEPPRPVVSRHTRPATTTQALAAATPTKTARLPLPRPVLRQSRQIRRQR
jgi:hypothetical protein